MSELPAFGPGTMANAEFVGLVAVVTGGASGIGAATVRELKARGARVATFDVASDPLADLSMRCDITDDAAVRAAVAQTADTLGGIDILVNNAGIGARGTIGETDDSQWKTVLDVNLLGAVRLCRAALPHLHQSQNAAIVNVGSIAAWTGLIQRVAYSASKGALHALTLAMASDHLDQGVRVNAVAPGTTDTAFVQKLLASAEDPAAERERMNARQPTGRLVTADEVAYAICALASPRAASTTGTILAVDGGSHWLRVTR